MKKYEVNGFRRVTSATAKVVFCAGQTIHVLPATMRPGSMHIGQGTPLNKATDKYGDFLTYALKENWFWVKNREMTLNEKALESYPNIKVMPVLTIESCGTKYRFADLVSCGDHWSGREVLPGGTLGEIVHRISREDYSNGTVKRDYIQL